MSPSLNNLLKQTSRSFHLTLRVLPGGVRPQIGLAYLLARTTDTIADTEIIPLTDRLEALQKFRGQILGAEQRPLGFGELARHQTSPAERSLLENSGASLAALRELSEGDRQLVRNVLDTIISGQELDLRRFSGWGETLGEPVPAKVTAREDSRPTAGKIIALQTNTELDDYTYRVAGCVGEFWTRMCRTHVFPDARLNETELLADAVGFGKGLQLVNILRDLPVDLRKGRCYIPADRLAGIGLRPAELLQPANEARFRPLYNQYLALAESHLAAGWDYTNAIPGGHMRVRLACAWPILIGLETIKRLRVEKVLNPQRRIKITRAEVRRVVVRSVLCYPRRVAWQRLFAASNQTSGKPVASGAKLA